jgi:hypothetical protein
LDYCINLDTIIKNGENNSNNNNSFIWNYIFWYDMFL